MDDLTHLIILDPSAPEGNPTIRDTGIRVFDILDMFNSGLKRKDIFARWPVLDLNDIEAAIQYEEDLEDIEFARTYKPEGPSIPWEEVKAELKRQGRL